MDQIHQSAWKYLTKLHLYLREKDPLQSHYLKTRKFEPMPTNHYDRKVPRKDSKSSPSDAANNLLFRGVIS